MARVFDGTNDNLTSADNAVSALDVDAVSGGGWFYKTVQPAGSQVIMGLITQGSGGGNRVLWRAIVPGTAGFRIQITHLFTVAPGDWSYATDLALTTRVHLGFTYDRSATTNDPLIYVNGVSVAVSETNAPSGTAQTGSDTLRMGENAGAAQDLEGVSAHQFVTTGTLAAADMNRAMWWGRPMGGLVAYHPFLTDKLADEGSAAATLTASGTTVSALALPTVRPGSALMGMGIGW